MTKRITDPFNNINLFIPTIGDEVEILSSGYRFIVKEIKDNKIVGPNEYLYDTKELRVSKTPVKITYKNDIFTELIFLNSENKFYVYKYDIVIFIDYNSFSIKYNIDLPTDKETLESKLEFIGAYINE